MRICSSYHGVWRAPICVSHLTSVLHRPSQRMLAVKHEVMGFFSSRRPEQPEEQLNNDPSVVRVIRSRFVRTSRLSGLLHLLPLQLLTSAFTSAQYGRQKGKDRESHHGSSSSALSQASSAPISPLHSPDDLSLHDSGSPRRYQPASSSTLRPRPPNLTITTDSNRTSTDVITFVSLCTIRCIRTERFIGLPWLNA